MPLLQPEWGHTELLTELVPLSAAVANSGTVTAAIAGASAGTKQREICVSPEGGCSVVHQDHSGAVFLPDQKSYSPVQLQFELLGHCM